MRLATARLAALRHPASQPLFSGPHSPGVLVRWPVRHRGPVDAARIRGSVLEGGVPRHHRGVRGAGGRPRAHGRYHPQGMRIAAAPASAATCYRARQSSHARGLLQPPPLPRRTPRTIRSAITSGSQRSFAQGRIAALWVGPDEPAIWWTNGPGDPDQTVSLPRSRTSTPPATTRTRAKKRKIGAAFSLCTPLSSPRC
jgi:hypothetical protein